MEEIKESILGELKRQKRLTTAYLAKKFGVSRQAVHRHLHDLVQKGIILKLGTSRKNSFYVLNSPATLKKIREPRQTFKKRYRRAGLEEQRVFEEVSLQPRFLENLAPEAKRTFHYALTEMANNAIDHSGSKFVDLLVESNPQFVSFTVADQGIGIFENIRKKGGLKTEMEGLQDLIKGKQTTLPDRHSGEGIFFTSKAVDQMVIDSHKKRLIFNGRLNDTFVSDIRWKKGTRIVCEIDNRTGKKLGDLFREFTNENFQFQKSRVTVKLFREGEEYMSRSQAKRILHALDKFSEVVLDFRDVETIGQGFADEIFRVFARQHPEIKIVPINCHENAQFMINRARS